MKRVLGVLLMVAGCYSPNIGNGQLKCSTNGAKCPDGYHCAPDSTCWKNGADPTGMPDMAQPVADMTVIHDLKMPNNADLTTPFVLPPHGGNSVMSGGVTAKSEHYKIIMSTGQPPGGNSNAASTNVKKKGGLVGATQGK